MHWAANEAWCKTPGGFFLNLKQNPAMTMGGQPLAQQGGRCGCKEVDVCKYTPRCL